VGSRSIAPPILSLCIGRRCALPPGKNPGSHWKGLAGPYVYILELCVLSVHGISTHKYGPSHFCIYRVYNFKTKIISFSASLLFSLRCHQILRYFRSVVCCIVQLYYVHFIYTYSLYCWCSLPFVSRLLRIYRGIMYIQASGKQIETHVLYAQ